MEEYRIDKMLKYSKFHLQFTNINVFALTSTRVDQTPLDKVESLTETFHDLHVGFP